MMTDITNIDLQAAILDQKVAGAFAGKRYAFVAIMSDAGWALGVAVQDEDGYNPIVGKTFETREMAQGWADGLNKHIGLTPRQAIDIVVSTMQRQGRGPDLRSWNA